MAVSEVEVVWALVWAVAVDAQTNMKTSKHLVIPFARDAVVESRDDPVDQTLVSVSVLGQTSDRIVWGQTAWDRTLLEENLEALLLVELVD